MESAPLTSAHALAREAIPDPSKSALASAEKHRAAALEFSRAAEGVDDGEALRILSLLEKHHQRLAHIVSSGFEHSSNDELVKYDASEEDSDHPRSESTSSALKSELHVVGAERQSLPSSTPPRRTAREMSSSIASNLATARGIPSTQTRLTCQLPPSTLKHSRRDGTISASSTAKSVDTSKARTALLDIQTQKHLTGIATSSAVTQSDKQDLPRGNSRIHKELQNDDPFQKFYATFEGLLTKLSAPLAFAGLPLVPEEDDEVVSNTTPNIAKAAAQCELNTTSPEMSKIFSQAALRAVTEEHGGKGIQESFLVVPTGGGTVSYAGILSKAERQARRHSLEATLDHIDEGAEHFVDARELQDMRASRIVQRASANAASPLTKTAEELKVENDSLKNLTDNLSRRLYMWEKSAQSQSMALQQSIRNLQPPTRTVSDAGRDQRHIEQDERFGELTEQFNNAQKEIERYGKENEKLRTVVMRYRERWEKLKEGARVRREGVEKGTEMPIGEM